MVVPKVGQDWGSGSGPEGRSEGAIAAERKAARFPIVRCYQGSLWSSIALGVNYAWSAEVALHADAGLHRVVRRTQ